MFHVVLLPCEALEGLESVRESMRCVRRLCHHMLRPMTQMPSNVARRATSGRWREHVARSWGVPWGWRSTRISEGRQGGKAHIPPLNMEIYTACSRP